MITQKDMIERWEKDIEKVADHPDLSPKEKARIIEDLQKQIAKKEKRNEKHVDG